MKFSKKKTLVLLSFGAAILAILVLGSSLSQMEFLPGRPVQFADDETTETDESGEAPALPSTEFSEIWRVLMTIIVWVILPVSILYLIVSSRARKQVLRDASRILFFLVMLFLIMQAFQQLRPPEELPQEELGAIGNDQSNSEFTTVTDLGVDPPQWITLIFSFILIAAVVSIGLYLWNQYAQRRLQKNPLGLITNEAQVALESLRSGANLKDTIIQCYHQMCVILAKYNGIQRRKAMTPREFQQYLESTGLRNEHIQRLTQLFESARYSDQTGNERAEKEAELCLEAIVQSYARLT